jgi:probable HAF family extracellular repeat protein
VLNVLNRCLVQCAISGLATSFSYSQPMFIDLGTLPGFDTSMANAISDDGLVVVGECGPYLSKRAFRWTAATGMQDLGLAPNAIDATAIDVNSDGTVVCGTLKSGAPGNPPRAFRWSGTTGMQELIGPYYFSQAFGMSPDGSILTGNSAGVVSYRWLEPTGMVPFSLCSATESIGLGISDEGVIVGASKCLEGPWPLPLKNIWRAYRWNDGLLGDFLPTLDDPWPLSYHRHAQALACSHDGQVIVGWSESKNGVRAVRWNPSGPALDLGPMPESVRMAVSGNGECVLGGSLGGGFVWTFANGMLSVSDYLKQCGLDPDRWSSLIATGASFDGATLAGYGTTNGTTRAWIATGLKPVLPCFSDCDQNLKLTIDDFICFQTHFVLGDPAADCDASGQLKIDDFICFQTLFSIGC